MRISKVKIDNYRSIKEAEIIFNDLTTFIGRNGVGKSTLLYAIDSFYDVNHQYTNHDYYGHKGEQTISIQITFKDLLPPEIEAFSKYLQNNELIVTKQINRGGARYYGNVMQIPQFAELRLLGARDKRARLVQLIQEGLFQDFGDVPRSSDDVEASLIGYELRHPDQCVLTMMPSQFLGPSNIGGGSLDNFTKFVLIPAVKDAAGEIGKKGAINQLLDLIVTRSISVREDFITFKAEFDERVTELYSTDNLPELAQLGELISEKLAKYSPGSQLNIVFGAITAPNMPLPEPLVTISEDGFSVPISYCGHGLQRALILALLEQLSLLSSGEQGQQLDQDLILAIEEPELYLHPARSRYISKLLLNLSESPAERKDTQVITVSHSPYFVEVSQFDNIRMCRKVPGEDELPKHTSFGSYTRLDAALRLAAITGRNPEDFTATSFVARATPVLNSMVNEGLFADVAVVVEGDSDASALWAMQDLMSKDWSKKHIVVVPVGGKNNIDRAIIAFQGFGIPTYFLFDGDRSKGEGAETNRNLLTLGGLPPEDFPNTQYSRECGVFEEALEAYLRSVVDQDFDRIRQLACDLYGYDQPSKAIKNSEVMSAFLKIAHDSGYEFQFLKEIVEIITAKQTT